MTKKQAGVIAVIAFAALLRPMGNLIEFVDIVWCLAVDGVTSPRWRMYNAILQEFGPTVMYWSRVSFDCIVAAIPALLIYRYLRRRDFTQVCMSCAAHKIRAWSLLVAYLALTLQNSSITVQHVVPFEAEGIPLDEAMEHSPTATLELRLCHPENDRLERELKANGRLTDEVLATAPQIEGYRLMRVRGKDDAVCYVCDDVELSMEDIVSARASKSLFNEGFYEVSAKLTPEGRGRLARLTRDYQPHGAKNSSNHGRALAIVVNGELAAAPIIQMEIDMGEFLITGKFTKEEAVNLAAALNSKNSEGD
jgi:hypothetical protein